MTPESLVDPEAFSAFERVGWERAALPNGDYWSGLTRQAVGPLLDAVGAGPGVRLLDVACGPGWLAAGAAERGAAEVGVDFSAAMVAEASRRFPAVEFRQGDAEALPFPDRCFDAMYEGSVRMAGLLRAQTPEALRAIRAAVRIAAEACARGGTVEVPMPAVLAFARSSMQ